MRDRDRHEERDRPYLSLYREREAGPPDRAGSRQGDQLLASPAIGEMNSQRNGGGFNDHASIEKSTETAEIVAGAAPECALHRHAGDRSGEEPNRC